MNDVDVNHGIGLKNREQVQIIWKDDQAQSSLIFSEEGKNILLW